MGYFKWRGGFFYRVWHLNAKYYSNSTTTGRSFRGCPYPFYPISTYTDLSFYLPSSLSFLYFSPSRCRYSCYSPIYAVSSIERPVGQEASFPDIQMRSNIIPGQLVATDALHGDAAVAVSARISRTAVTPAAEATCAVAVRSLARSLLLRLSRSRIEKRGSPG